MSAVSDFAANVFRWRRGRQGTGYDKMLLATLPWPLAFDCYVLRYPEGTEIPPHRDPVAQRRHYRLNVILKASPAGGEFVCATPIFANSRIKFFRPDLCEHSVTRVVGGTRYVLSIGWLWGRKTGSTPA